MSSIHLTSFISAPPKRVFDLARSVSFYKTVLQAKVESFKTSTTANLMGQHEGFSIQARNIKKTRTAEFWIQEIKSPDSFLLEQKKGNFQSYKHWHYFKQIENGTLLIDKVEYGLPDDFIGKILGRIYLEKCLIALIEERNLLIRQYSESEKWRMILV